MQIFVAAPLSIHVPWFSSKYHKGIVSGEESFSLSAIGIFRSAVFPGARSSLFPSSSFTWSFANPNVSRPVVVPSSLVPLNSPGKALICISSVGSKGVIEILTEDGFAPSLLTMKLSGPVARPAPDISTLMSFESSTFWKASSSNIKASTAKTPL